MPDRARLLQEVVLEDGVLKSFVVEQEDHRIRHLPAGVSPESDADGERVPIRDAAGEIKGYVGSSGNGVAMWFGTEPLDFNFPSVFINAAGVYIQSNAGGEYYLNFQPDGLFDLSASKVKLRANCTGITGTDVVNNATDAASVIARLNELLAVCRNLGIIHA